MHDRPYSEKVHDIYHELNLSVWKAFEKNEIDAVRLRTLRFELFLKEMGWNHDPVEWGRTYLEGIVEFSTLFDQALQILDYAGSKYKLAAVTNGLREVQRPRLRKCGIYEKFDHIVVSDEIGYSKPDIEFFEYLFKRIGPHSRNELLMVGDSLSSDMRGARNAGIDTCWLDLSENKLNRSAEPEVNYRITKLDELQDII